MKSVDQNLSLNALVKAKKQLDFAIMNAKSELEITGAIKCFEYCFELSWKTMKKILESMGIPDLNSPRTVFAAAFRNKLIDDVDVWHSFILQRNLTSHTYDEDLAHDVFDSLKKFSDYLDTFIKLVQKGQQ